MSNWLSKMPTVRGFPAIYLQKTSALSQFNHWDPALLRDLKISNLFFSTFKASLRTNNKIRFLYLWHIDISYMYQIWNMHHTILSKRQGEISLLIKNEYSIMLAVQYLLRTEVTGPCLGSVMYIISVVMVGLMLWTVSSNFSLRQTTQWSESQTL